MTSSAAAAPDPPPSPEPLLSELCRICNIHVPKYRCPRCLTRTCSLACSKRHKQWAQCSGVRDPAEYLPRSKLANPASIDRDFNFLVGVERGLERAERELEGRGIEVGAELEGRRRRFKKGEGNARAALDRCGVRLLKAPKGMVRERENRTGWNQKRKCLSWTVEWLFPESERHLVQALETDTLAEAVRKVEDERKRLSRKRKRDAGEDTQNETRSNQKAGETEGGVKPVEREAESKSNSYDFYLHDPTQASTSPLSRASVPPDKPLKELLRGKVIREFPTISITPTSPEQREDQRSSPHPLPTPDH